MSRKQSLEMLEQAAYEEPADALRMELERRGVGGEFARSAAEALLPFVDELPDGQWEGVLSGVSLAFGVHRRTVESFHKTAQDLEVVQRLLGSFGSELQKLDEALELLAAYAARLRTQTASADRTLH